MKNNKEIRGKQSVVVPSGLGRWRQEETVLKVFS